jgi:hypothetical protein
VSSFPHKSKFVKIFFLFFFLYYFDVLIHSIIILWFKPVFMTNSMLFTGLGNTANSYKFMVLHDSQLSVLSFTIFPSKLILLLLLLNNSINMHVSSFWWSFLVYKILVLVKDAHVAWKVIYVLYRHQGLFYPLLNVMNHAFFLHINPKNT